MGYNGGGMEDACMNIRNFIFAIIATIGATQALGAQYVRINGDDTVAPNGGMTAPTVLR